MRNFIRHPAEIPIEVIATCDTNRAAYQVSNISHGGLQICSEHAFTKNNELLIRINSVEPTFEAYAKVSWCRRSGDHYKVGLEFINQQDVYKARMVEQVCHIMHYRNQVLKKEGRNLGYNEAASEWVQRYAAKFPNLGKHNS